jgi:hypothetical protein
VQSYIDLNFTKLEFHHIAINDAVGPLCWHSHIYCTSLLVFDRFDNINKVGGEDSEIFG